MAQGPGKYDDLATYVRTESHAQAAIVIVIGGNKGDGFSVQAIGEVTRALPSLLRIMADQIDRDVGNT